VVSLCFDFLQGEPSGQVAHPSTLFRVTLNSLKGQHHEPVEWSKPSLLTTIFAFLILICPVPWIQSGTFGYEFSKDYRLILNRSTSHSVLGLKNPFSQSYPLFFGFSVFEDSWQKLSSIPILKLRDSLTFDQRFPFYPWNYSNLKIQNSWNKSFSSPPAAGSSTYPLIKRKVVRQAPEPYGSGQAHHIINYRKASIIGGLNLVAIIAGFHQAMNIWGESKGRFHIKDDWKGDGLAQTDEISHFLWGYKMTQFFYWTYDWVGFSPKTSQILSSSESALILTLVEYPIDAYNPKQGLGVSDLIFNYLGVGMAIVRKHQSWLNDFDFKISWKKNIFSVNKTPFAQTYEEYDNFIYWFTYRPKLFLPKKLLCFGFGYSVTHLGFRPFSRQSRDQGRPKRELYGGIGLSIPDFISLFGRKLGDKTKFLEILYPNIRIKL